MKKRLQKGPLTIAVNASGKCWRFYKSGVLSSRNRCPTKINHGVVVVGLSRGGTKSGGKQECRKATWKEKKAGKCVSHPFEKLGPNKAGKPNRRCCKQGAVETREYWLVQNSWGKGWGDKGFIKLAVEGGKGVSGMNQYVNYMDVV